MMPRWNFAVPLTSREAPPVGTNPDAVMLAYIHSPPVPGTSLKFTALMLPAFPLNVKSPSAPAGTMIFIPMKSLLERTNATSSDPVQVMGGRMAPPTSQPKPVMCSATTGALVS